MKRSKPRSENLSRVKKDHSGDCWNYLNSVFQTSRFKTRQISTIQKNLASGSNLLCSICSLLGYCSNDWISINDLPDSSNINFCRIDILYSICMVGMDTTPWHISKIGNLYSKIFWSCSCWYFKRWIKSCKLKKARFSDLFISGPEIWVYNRTHERI